jgi:hypothetical protein
LAKVSVFAALVVLTALIVAQEPCHLHFPKTPDSYWIEFSAWSGSKTDVYGLTIALPERC